MFKFLPIFCLALMAVNAYDFSDTYFNQFLFNEYELLNLNAQTRLKRNVQELSAEELAKEIVDSLPENPTEDEKDNKNLNTLIVLQTFKQEKDNSLHDDEKVNDSTSEVVEKGADSSAHSEIPEEKEEPVSTSTMTTTTTTTMATTTSTTEPSTKVYIHPTTVKPTTTTTKTTKKVVTTSSPSSEEEEKTLQCKSGLMEMKNDLTCCDANRHDPAYFAMLRGTKKQCAQKLRTNNPDVENFDPFNCGHMEKIKQLIICESECVAKTLNMIDEHGEISRDAIIKNFKTHLSGIEDSKIKSFEVYVDKCLMKIKNINTHGQEGKCSSLPMEFQHCMFGEMVIGCPKEHQVGSQRCQKIRERYGRGESLALGKTSILDFLHPSKRNNVYSKA